MSVAPFYGGLPGLDRRLELSSPSLARYLATGEVDLVPAYADAFLKGGD